MSLPRLFCLSGVLFMSFCAYEDAKIAQYREMSADLFWVLWYIGMLICWRGQP